MHKYKYGCVAAILAVYNDSLPVSKTEADRELKAWAYKAWSSACEPRIHGSLVDAYKAGIAYMAEHSK
jgi:hypothetical protein